MTLLGVSLLVMVAAALPPFCGNAGAAALHGVFSSVCHQMPDRSFSVGGIPFALCHRCFGLAVGLFWGALVAGPAFRVRSGVRRYGVAALAAVTVLLLADWFAAVTDLFEGSPMSRFMTGVAAGFVAAWFVVDAVLDWAGFEAPGAPIRPLDASLLDEASPT